MNSNKKDNIITATLLCLICIISSGLILISKMETKEVEVAFDKWDNRIIDITGIDYKKITNTDASIKLDIDPGIKKYNLTIENDGTLNSYIKTYNIISDIDDKDITYNINVTAGEFFAPSDSKTYKLTIDNKGNETYEDVSLIINIDMVNKIPLNVGEYDLNSIKYNNQNITKNKETYKFEDNDNYIVFSNRCYSIIEINKNDILAIYSKEFDGTKCLNKKMTLKTTYNDIAKIFEEVSSSGEIIKEFEYSNNDLLHMASFNVLNQKSKITLLKTNYSKTIDWLLNENGEYALANDNNYHLKTEKLNITPVIKIKDVEKIAGKGSLKNPYIIRSYIEG